jgi:RNA polymerase sigma-70 factor (ECF subfamily)
MAVATVELRVAGRADELETLVDAHKRMVYRIAFCLLRNHHDAEDAAQETFLKVWRAAGKLPGVADPKAWIARIAWNVAMDRARAGRSRHEVDIESLARSVVERDAHGATAEQIAAGAELQRLLEALIGSLPPKLREVLVLSTVEELEHAEIAMVLGAKEGAVRMRLFQGRQVLREKLARLLKN